MAMTVSELKDMLSETSGDEFVLTSEKIGIDTVTQLFNNYLPGGRLDMTNAAGDADKLQVTGKMTIGQLKGANTRVSFYTDESKQSVTGIYIESELTEWEFDTGFIEFSGNVLRDSYGMKSPSLILDVGEDDWGIKGPRAAISVLMDIKATSGIKMARLKALIPNRNRPGSVVLGSSLSFKADFEDLMLGGLDSLIQFAPGAKFDVLPVEIPVVQNLSLRQLELVMNPEEDSVSGIRINVYSSAGLKIIEGKFEIPGFYFKFAVMNINRGISVGATIGAVIDVFGQVFDISMGLPEMYFQGTLMPETPISLKPFISNFISENFVPDFKLDKMILGLGLKSPNNFEFYIRLTDLWNVSFGNKTCSMKNLSFYMSGSRSGGTGISINSQLDLAGTVLYFSALHPEGGKGWEFEGGTSDESSISIGGLIGELGDKFGIDVPAPVKSMNLRNLLLSFKTSEVSFLFTCGGDLKVDSVDVRFMVKVDIKKAVNIAGADVNAGYSVKFSGMIDIGGFEFDVLFNTDDKRSEMFIATYSRSENDQEKINVYNLVASLSQDLASIIPKTLELDLKDIKFIFSKQGNNKKFAIGLDLSTSFSLSEIPLIGSKLPSGGTVAVNNLQFLYSSVKVDSTETALFNGLLPQKVIPLPSGGILQGINLAAVVQLGDEKITFGLPASEGREVVTYYRLEGEGPGDAQNSATKWFEVQKSFGPVKFEKIGVRYKNRKLFVLMNSSLSAGGLTIGMVGLGLGSPVNKFEPAFNIDGLDITFKGGPVTISGGMLGTLEPIDFTGELILSFGALTISALGAYAQKGGNPSFFLYAVLDYPIGGPAFFFVNGLAAGFGFNRRLLVPGIEGVSKFPLVQWAMGTGNSPGAEGSIGDRVSSALTTLSQGGVVAPSVGDNWLAAGIKFSSFQVVDSFALLVVKFGTEFEIDLLGLSRLSIPTGAVTPVALVELQLKASFVPSHGILSIEGQLTPSSYILSRDCHLTGGFAFYLWFSGEHKGDFVVTLGGYSPHFTPPSHYPKVPRLGINWKVSGELTIKGELYFALTSSAVMAGGMLNAVWQSGSVRAWFDAHADFLMVFKPFHYYVGIGINLGASVRINLLLTSFTLSVSIGVGLELWGPEFAGKAIVDLSVVSFTISFGNSGQDTSTTIGWSEFVTQMLPGGESTPSRADKLLAGSNTRKDPTDIVSIRIVNGLVKQLSDTEGQLNFIVNAEDFEMETSSVIPSKDYILGANIKPAPKEKQPKDERNREFGVGPTGTDNDSFGSTHRIYINSNQNSVFMAVSVLNSIPKAFWEKRYFDGHGVPAIGNPLKNTTIDNVLTGFRITPSVKDPDQTLPVDLENLKFTVDENIQRFDWSRPQYQTADSFSKEEVSTSIESITSVNNRSTLFAAMNAINLDVLNEADVDTLADPSGNYLLAPPSIRLLGEVKKTD